MLVQTARRIADFWSTFGFVGPHKPHRQPKHSRVTAQGHWGGMRSTLYGRAKRTGGPRSGAIAIPVPHPLSDKSGTARESAVSRNFVLESALTLRVVAGCPLRWSGVSDASSLICRSLSPASFEIPRPYFLRDRDQTRPGCFFPSDRRRCCRAPMAGRVRR